VMLSIARSVTATFTRGAASLAVGRLGSGTGTVIATTGGIVCGAVCSFSYVIGSTVTLTATPDVGVIFAGWGGACNGTTPSCTLVLAANAEVTATFSRIFTNPMVTAGVSVITAVDITDLRSAIDTVRSRLKAPAVQWTNAIVATVIIRAFDLSELRTALTDTYVMAGKTPLPQYTDPTLVPGQTVVRAVHVNEIQNYIMTLELALQRG